MLLGDVFEQRGEADAAADDLQEALACSSLLAPLMPALATLIVDDLGTSLIRLCKMPPRSWHRREEAGPWSQLYYRLTHQP